MLLKKLVTVLAAASLVAGPTMASAQSAAPLAPAEETVEGSALDEGAGQLLPLVVIILIVLLARELVKDRDSGDPPVSP